MLSKLIKYEFKATRKYMLVMYAVLVLISAVISVNLKLNISDAVNALQSELGGRIYRVMQYFILATYIIVNIVVITGMFFYSISRFKKNILGNEGYLMHTLPVSPGLHVIAKMVVSVVWTFVSFIAAGVSYSVLSIGIADSQISKDIFYIVMSIDYSKYITSSHLAGIIAAMAGYCVVSLSAAYLRVYAAMSIGYSFRRMRAVCSVAVYLLLGVTTSVIKTIPQYLLGLVVTHSSVYTVILGESMYSAVGVVIYYCLARYFLSRRLRLL